MTSTNSPDNRPEEVHQDSLLPEPEAVVARSTSDIAQEIAQTAIGKDPYREQKARDRSILESRGEDISGFRPTPSPEVSFSEKDDDVEALSLDEDIDLAGRLPDTKHREELPTRGRSNWQTLTPSEVMAQRDAMDPLERARQDEINARNIAEIKEGLIKADEPKIESVVEKPELQRKFKKRNAFGGAIDLDYYGFKPERVEDVTEDDLAKVDIEYLQSVLINGRGQYSVSGLSLNPLEYTAIVRNPQAFGRAITARTFAAREQEPDLDRRKDAAVRSSEHAFDSKDEVMTKMLTGYMQEEEQLKRLRKEMNSPGYAHMSEVQLRGLVSSAMNISFKNLLDTVAVQEGWDNETRENADNALIKMLLTGKQQDKVNYWKNLTDLNLNWNHAKQVLTRQRLAQIRRSQ